MESYAEDYISKHSDQADVTFRKVFSYAINQAVIRSMIEKSGPLLHRAVESGQEQQVRDLLKQNLISMNEPKPAGPLSCVLLRKVILELRNYVLEGAPWQE